jgi:transposase-like protein
MGKSRSRSKENHYKNIIQKQKSMIRNLQKQLSRFYKQEERYVELEEKEAEILLREEIEERQEITSTHSCPRCNNELYVIDGNRRKVYLCHDCDYRCSVAL